ncbi:MAG: hypothetical protein WCG31_09900 [Deltaproteobacteria bacterium]
MWFLKTEFGTFCVRYLREGYGLFMGEDFLSWHKDAETAAAKVSAGQTGCHEWDSQSEVVRPKGLGEWLTSKEMQLHGSFTRDYDPVIVDIECGCGYLLKESIRRIKTLSAFRCPECRETIRINLEQLLEIMESTKKKYPDGYIKGLNPR